MDGSRSAFLLGFGGILGLQVEFCATLNTYKHALCRYNADKFAKYRLRGYTFLLYIWDIERLQVDSSASP